MKAGMTCSWQQWGCRGRVANENFVGAEAAGFHN
jgi:hypothetical protein